MTVGQTATIVLPEDPMTLSPWMYEITGGGAAEVVLSRYDLDPAAAAGDTAWLRVLTVKAAAPGEAVIAMTRKSDDGSVQTAAYRVTVTEAPEQSPPPGTPPASNTR